MYADYTFYKNSFGGVVIPEERFGYFCVKASAYLDYMVCRELTEDDITTAVKNAVCDIAEVMFGSESAMHTAGISSETVGSHSVSYSSSADKELNGRMNTALKFWLGNSGLLYVGTDVNG